MATGLETVTWIGISRTRYDFQLHPIGVEYLVRPGVYIFCKSAGLQRWLPAYIGQTSSFEKRLSRCLSEHHQLANIRAAGATHLCTLHVPGGEAERLRIETDLRHAYTTPCNRQ